MRRTSLILANFLFCLAYAQAQRELLGKLVKGDDQSRTPVGNVSVSLDEDGSHDITKDGGLFHLFLSDALKPGVEVTITVTMPGYAVYEPPGGKLIVPVDLIHRKEIQLLSKGSPKFLSDAQLRALVERTARESSRSAVQPDTKQPPDLSRYLKDWAVHYGFSVDQVQAEVSRWASEVESRKSSAYDLGLAAFARKNFIEAHDRAMEAAAEEEGSLASLQKQQQEGTDRIIRDYRLAGDAAYNALDFAKASDAYQRALAHVPQNEQGVQWAELQNRLGNAELDLISRSEGTAISAHEKSARNAFLAALTVYTRDQLPQEWAQAQSNLGGALCELADRSEGTQASQYLQQAVDAFRSALQVEAREKLPQDWAQTQNNLGVALDDLADRSEGPQASQFLQQAADAYRSTLPVEAREQLPQVWAMTQSNLGIVLYELAGHSEGAQASQFLQQAVDAYRSALQVTTREQLPQAWAMTQGNLGVALDELAQRSEGAQASQFLQQAVDAYRSALQVRTREQLPQGWAATQNNLGGALYHLAGRSEGAQASQYLQQAVDAYRSALQVYTESAFPALWTVATQNLAILYEDRRDWIDAYQCYEQLLGHDPTNQHLKAKVNELSGKGQP
jgi:tetratricopeptide (TPR) repeat protein